MSSNIESNIEEIVTALKDKACTKQKIYRINLEIFAQLKKILQQVQTELRDRIKPIDKYVEITYRETGLFEAEIKFGGDILTFSMHTNVFFFAEGHDIFQSEYVKQDPLNAYCGMIQIHNFLSDSLKYNRYEDVGYLIARVFINKEKHFFVEGQRQLGFLYNDFENAVINDVYLRAIIESAILYALDFDLLAPPYQEVHEITVKQKKELEGLIAQKTGKRVGYKFSAEYKKDQTRS